jgi:hypothetical protein
MPDENMRPLRERFSRIAKPQDLLLTTMLFQIMEKT